MDRIPQTPPIIPPLEKGLKRPLWSVMIPVYNCSEYIPEAIESVLSQDMGEEQMQIEVVDDDSTDTDIQALVLRLGKGRVGYYRQPENRGSLRNFETCIKRAKGKLIHLLHGDDKVKNDFYDEISSLFQRFPEAGAAFTNYDFIDENGKQTGQFRLEEKEPGILNNWLVRLASSQKIQYAGIVVKREVYEHLGSFYGSNCGEDWEMWVRIAKHYPMAYSPKILASYREQIQSITWENAVSGKLFESLKISQRNIQKHLLEKDRAIVLKKSDRHLAHFFLGMAWKVWHAQKNVSCSTKLIQQSLIFDWNLYSSLRILKFYLSVSIYKLTGKSFFL
ncbi:glycosyltransferase family 2 protein [Cognataquiflexum rubidum]|uniref:glycosyltransferase family 2 protein n=1 Tax=Cognataquiflexum rubidum TaxID=2922273 RepID=UPI001F13DB60|nr:glycosyltransferase [Cognataquiflexum rubidum]MCH6234045.1 glycosyltransferase [Cognataquiflexum rubidum]